MPHKPGVAHRLSKLDVEGATTLSGATALNGATSFGLPAALKSYTTAGVPDAADHDGEVIHVTDGDTGSPCLAVSNGTSWLRIALGTAIAAS